MRFRRLELVRYGAFADRVFDFGAGGRDLHLVVGPNEAGKSTALQAIGDFLFGIPAQSSQNWRYDYAQLRLRALIEHDGDLLEATRRKGNRDTLLKPDGTAYDGNPLAPFLAGVDRAAFERMFGLDHAKLRRGGESILSGRDDAARITLEAGTGLSQIGSELKRLEDIASSLFKPSGQNPLVNQLLRERTDAMTQIRQRAVSEADWKAVRDRRNEAERRRTELIEEADDLDRQQARLDRLGRARTPLARLDLARRELAALPASLELPTNAAERLAKARETRTADFALDAQIRESFERQNATIQGVDAPGRILELRAIVEGLNERRPVIEKGLADLDRRRSELDRIEARIATARTEARLPNDGKLPTAGWRKRAATHIQERRELRQREATVASERSRLTRDRESAVSDLAKLGDSIDPSALAAAIERLPLDSVERTTSASEEARRKAVRVSEGLAALAPWRGDLPALHAMQPPTEAEAQDVRRSIEAARTAANAAREDGEAAEASAVRARMRLKVLTAAGPLPTAEAVAEARAHRDDRLADVRSRLKSDRRADDGKIGQQLADAVHAVDGIVDQRDLESARVAEHSLAVVSLEEAEALLVLAQTRQTSRMAEGDALEHAWNTRLLSVGFQRPILPADYPTWALRRDSVLEAERERIASEERRAEIATRVKAAQIGIVDALTEVGVTGMSAKDPRLAEHARRTLNTLTAAAADRATLQRHIMGLEKTEAELSASEGFVERSRTKLAVELDSLLKEVDFCGEIDEAALVDALEALAQIADDIVNRDGIIRQINGIEHDALAFEREVRAALDELGLPLEKRPTDAVLVLGGELARAIRAEEALTAWKTEHDRLTKEAEGVRHRLADAQATIDVLMQAAGAESEDALDELIRDDGRRRLLKTAEGEALAELAGSDAGAGLDALAAEIANLDPEDEAVDRRRIDDRRREVGAERESIGRDLAAAEAEAKRVADESAAADAQQAATETGHALAQAAEEHVEAAAAAALLRWVIDRHRTTNQAPLIARAGALFSEVTDGAFSGLSVGYDRDDRPVILPRRRDGTEVQVDALSEGTRDQLFLALRLGSIDGAAGVAALPIVCDDLLITADDARAASLLRVLGTAAKRNQVIVFSHHEHLVDVATKAIGSDGFRLHRIAAVGASNADGRVAV